MAMWMGISILQQGCREVFVFEFFGGDFTPANSLGNMSGQPGAIWE